MSSAPTPCPSPLQRTPYAGCWYMHHRIWNHGWVWLLDSMSTYWLRFHALLWVSAAYHLSQAIVPTTPAIPKPPNTHAHTHPLPSAPKHDIEHDNDPLATPTTSCHYPGRTNRQQRPCFTCYYHHLRNNQTPRSFLPTTMTPCAPSPGQMIKPAAPPIQQHPPPSHAYHLGLMNMQVIPPCHPYPPPPHTPFPGQTITPAASPLQPPLAALTTIMSDDCSIPAPSHGLTDSAIRTSHYPCHPLRTSGLWNGGSKPGPDYFEYGAVRLVTANFVQWLCSTATVQNRSSRNRIRENNIILPLNTCILLENITQTWLHYDQAF